MMIVCTPAQVRIQSCMGRTSLLLPTLANTLGMASCGVLGTGNGWSLLKSRYRGDKSFRTGLFLTATVDLVSGMMLSGGIFLTGGAVFVVLYNSCPVWTALLSKYALGRPLSSGQSVGVCLVCMGLIANVLANSRTHSADVGKVVSFGSVIVLAGCVLHSAFFVLSDKFLRGAGHNNCHGNEEYVDTKSNSGGGITIQAPIWSCCLGSMEAGFMTLFVFAQIHFRGFREEQDSSASCSASTFSKGFVALFLLDAVHAAAFFLLLKQIGAVGSALLKGAQAVVVVILSAIFFCSKEESQCLTSAKAGSIVLVLSGTIWYANESNKISNSGDKLKAMPKQLVTTGEELLSVEIESLLT